MSSKDEPIILPDVLAHGLRLVFCGTAASAISAREAAYYANPTNAFWRTLYTIGLTPRLFAPSDFRHVLQLGIGLTDLAKQASGNDRNLAHSDFDIEGLSQTLRHYHPRLLAFTSKKAASVFFDMPTRKLDYGQQAVTFEQTRFWVLPSPSGAARGYWDIDVWQELANAYTSLAT